MHARSMGYRDELGAAVQRADSNERALVEERSKVAAKDAQIALLQEQVANAEKGIATVPTSATIATTNASAHPLAIVMQRFLWAFAAFSVLSIAAAMTESESKGVAMARLLGAICVAAISGQVMRRRPIKQYLAAVALGFLVGVALIQLFFATIWRVA